MSILVTEMFYSIQGEGRFVGVPSIFIRTFGCPFTCAGFGQSRNKDEWLPESEMPHNLIDVKDLSSLEDMPVPTVGCDSSAAWSKKLKHLSKEYTASELVTAIEDLAREHISPARIGSEVHIVFTGGEPLVPKWQRFYAEFFPLLAESSMTIYDVTFETNGFYELRPEFMDFLNKHSTQADIEWTFSVSPKLSISGEPQERAIRPGSVSSYRDLANSYVYSKYVVRDADCLADVEAAQERYLNEAGIIFDSVYLMPEGATTDLLALTESQVADVCLNKGYRFSPRLHCHLFGNGWGT